MVGEKMQNIEKKYTMSSFFGKTAYIPNTQNLIFVNIDEFPTFPTAPSLEKTLECDVPMEIDSNQNIQRIEIEQMDVDVVQEKLSEKKFQCPNCNKRLCSKQSLQRHLKAEINRKNKLPKRKIEETAKPPFVPDPKFQCPNCEKFLSSNQALKRHLAAEEKRKHKIVKNHKCKLCDKTFKSTYLLENHDRIVHLNIKFQCDKCKKKFAWKLRLKMHLQSH